MGFWSFVILAQVVLPFVFPMENGLARTPPMGWLSWERFLCNIDCINYPDDCISERLYKETADRMAQDGYKDAGYEYVNIDDCWSLLQRDEQGTLVPDPDRFPSGIKALADYVHAKGLKLGIYLDSGTMTCEKYPGSYSYMEKDAQTIASWEVDMLKMDGCFAGIATFDIIYPIMSLAMNKTGRPMIFSCSWPAYEVGSGITPNYDLMGQYCNLWRNYLDISDDWRSVSRIIDFYAENQELHAATSGPGRWHDPDMLIIGNYGLSVDQSRTQMAMWAILAAPLLMSTDLRKISREHKAILINKHVIAVNQDKLGRMGRRVLVGKNLEVWLREVLPLSRKGDFSAAIVFLNRRPMGGPTLMQAYMYQLGLYNPEGYLLTDLFNNNTSLGIIKPHEKIRVMVNLSGVVMLKATILSENSKVI